MILPLYRWIRGWFQPGDNAEGTVQEPPSWHGPPVTTTTITTPSVFSHAERFTIGSLTSTSVQVDNRTVVQQAPGPNGREILEDYVAHGAIYEPRTTYNAPRCAQDTQQHLLREIEDWIDDNFRDDKILHLSGAAGTGKSAIIHSAIEMLLQRDRRVASWFFQHADPTRNTKTSIVATIVHQLAQAYPVYGEAVYTAIAHNTSIFSKTLNRQINTLIIQPWLSAFPAGTSPSSTHVITVDALDHCQGVDHQADVMVSISKLATHPQLPFKLIISSRPGVTLESALHDQGDSNIPEVHHIQLHDHDTTEDIRAYLYRTLRMIGRTQLGVPADWPSEDEIERLVRLSGGHWLYVSAVLDYIKDPLRPTAAALTNAISWKWNFGREDLDILRPHENPFVKLDAIYTDIFRKAAQRHPSHSPQFLLQFLMTISEPKFAMLGVENIEDMLDLQPGTIEATMSDLSSLVSFPLLSEESASGMVTTRKAVRIRHPSLRDFVGRILRSKELYIPKSVIHLDLATIILDRLATLDYEDFVSYWHCTTRGTPDSRREIVLQNWVDYLYDGIPESGMEHGTWCPIYNEDLLQTFVTVARRGVFDKYARALRDPRICSCLCNLRRGSDNRARLLGSRLFSFVWYMEAHLPLATANDQEGWKFCFAEVQKVLDAILDYRRRPFVNTIAVCPRCTDVAKMPGFPELAARMASMNEMTQHHQDFRLPRHWQFYVPAELIPVRPGIAVGELGLQPSPISPNDMATREGLAKLIHRYMPSVRTTPPYYSM